jgi:serine/threonine-protein kinase HipA
VRRTIRVFLGDEARPLGVIHFNQDGTREHAAFEYDASWLTNSDRFAIDPALPLVAGPQFRPRAQGNSVFPLAIADTEPDGWGRRVIQRDHAKRRQEARRSGQHLAPAPLNDLDYLLAVDDASRVGGLRFQDEEGVFCRAAIDGRRAPPLIELRHLLQASHAVETNRETIADLEYLLGRGTSLGGLRPKCTIVDNSGHLSIGKFPSVADERAVTKGEVLALRLAEAAGINAAQAELIDSDGTPVALIRRFDRPPNGGRLMYVSAATMLGAETTDPIEHTYTEMVDVLRTHGSQPQADIEELWRRIAFSILITNVDDHLHNHGFLHVHKGQWTLSPAFDVNPFPDRLRELKTWIAEDTGPEASVEALLSVVGYFRIRPNRAREILSEVETAIARWREFASSVGMTETDVEQFADAFEHEQRGVAQRAIA